MDGTAPYLLVLYAAEQRRSPPIPPRYVAASLDRSPSATTEMFQRLADRGLIVHEPYDGATLTEQGRDIAVDLQDQFVTLARFFDEVLDLDDPRSEALTMTGRVSDTVTDRLAATLLSESDPGTSPAVTDLLELPDPS